ncbi:ATP synthase subunit I [Mangrovibacillus sp. Mu-81]|jgi:ATP synthase protein I|uniref:ATP synthase subunit I n=1 Tax=Bacillaceae TaxID=186817 RepID=UPI00155809B7|nr:ATP synthase subunit I [Bacillus haikouensis]NQD67885.1 ATP synthase subunit I [Bacillus haikouensis]
MPELHQMFNRQRKYILYLLAVYVLGWGFTDHKSVFLGLALGTALSLYMHWGMTKRVDKFGEAVVAGKKVRSLGTTSRMAAAALGVIIVTRFPETFHLLSLIIGLMTTYIVIMIDYFFSTIKTNK